MAEGTRKNPLEYEREYNEFMYKLRRFLASKDMPLRKLPLFGGEEIDLYLLYKTVTNFGGWLKVTDERKWHEVAKCFNLPPSCLNSAFALRQLYVRYLEAYEKLYYLGEDGDDSVAYPRLNGYQLGHSSFKQSRIFNRDPQKNFERLVLSLQSGLPNEVDFAINICMLLSNVNNSVFNLAKAPAVVDMILAHVGVFLEDSYGSSDLYKEWYKSSGKDFLKFWKRVVNCEEIKELLLDNDPNDGDSNMFCAEEIFNLDKTATHRDYELQRVLQVCTILHNFSFDKMDASVLSSHPICLRFLLFCLHSNIGSLKKLATDTMSNLADKTVLEPLESLNTQLFFFMVDRYVQDSDRYNRICAMNILRKISRLEENQDSVCKALSNDTYETLIKVLILQDVQLLISSLETLYQLSGLGQVPCDCIVAVEKSIEILVSILNACVESFEAETLAHVKVVDNYHSMVMAGAKGTPGKVYNPDQTQRHDVESEALAQHWLRTAYDVDPASTVLQRDLYGDYLTSCGKISRSAILNSASFFKILRFVFPDVQVVKLNTGNQQLYGLVGMRRRLTADQVHGQTVNHAARPQLVRTPTPPLHTTLSGTKRAPSPVTIETNYVKIPQPPQRPTPPPQRPTPPVQIRRPDNLIPNNPPPQLPIAVQSSSLPGQRRDVIDVIPRPQAPQVILIAPMVQQQAPTPGNTPRPNQLIETGSNHGNHVTPTINGPSHMGIANQNIPAAIANVTQHTPAVINKNLNQAPAGSVVNIKPDVVPSATGSPNVPTSDNNLVTSSVEQSPQRPVNPVGVGEQETVDKSHVTVNGAENHVDATSVSQNVVKCSETTVHAPVVNGAETNGKSGVLYVAKEENASKMTREEHEVVIAVVENPTKTPSLDLPVTTTSSDLVAGSRRKRANSLLSDMTSDNSGTNEPKFNGPFVASEMLRSVAKRQRCHSEGDVPPLVNGVSGSNEPKDTMAWDEVPRTFQKSPLPSPKVPLNVNGVRLDLVTQHVQIIAPKIGTALQSTVINNIHKPNSVIFPGVNTPASNGIINQPVGQNSAVSNPGTGTPSSLVATSSSAPHVVVVRNTVTTTSPDPAVLPGSTVTKDTSRGAETRGEQAPGPYRCMWDGCGCSFTNSKLLYNHAVSTHAPIDQLFTSCQWEGCSNVRRSRASLLFHLRQRHLTAVPLSQTNSAPKPQKTPPTNPVASPSGAPVVGRPVYPPHPSVNPLLMNLKEQLLQTEHESPLTKSIRLTAALILRNIAKYSPTGRRKLKRFESSFTEIMCSRLESSGAMAACLHELTRRRQQQRVLVPKR